MGKNLLKRTANACVALASLVAVVAACENDAYDTGDGSLSYMRADFVEATTDGKASVVAATTDDGRRLMLSPSMTASWIATKDTTYRALLYYNDVGQTSSEGTAVKPIAIRSVMVPKVIDASGGNVTYPTDPVVFDTSWLSASRRYINLGVYLKTGKSDDDAAVQRIGLAYVGTSVGDDGKRVHTLRLVHDQGNVPEYYSTQVYVSIPLYGMTLADGDDVEVLINTYDGEVKRTFTIKKD